MFLLAALFMGLAGGSFPVGIAYVASWFPARRQGTALGIFGAGNVGSAVTSLLAPTVMVAYGWMAVARIWAVGLAVAALIFYVFSNEVP
jgi:NNP family nitrate/nitrite transporter-like MFS transporter